MQYAMEDAEPEQPAISKEACEAFLLVSSPGYGTRDAKSGSRRGLREGAMPHFLSTFRVAYI